MNKGIIYKITNIINNKIYIGKTEKTILERWNTHLYSVNREECKHFALYKAITKYGEQNFKIEPIEEIDCSLLNEREKHWISHYNSFGQDGYNMTIGGGGLGSGSTHPHFGKRGENSPLFGRKHSLETRAKMSRKGEKHHNFGKRLSENTKKKISEAMSGEKHPFYGKFGKEHPNYGRKFSDELKNVLSIQKKVQKIQIQNYQKQML